MEQNDAPPIFDSIFKLDASHVHHIMSTPASPAISPQPELGKAGSSRKRNKDPKKASWRDNYANQLLSGIEFKCHKTGEVVHFTVIQHKEVHKKDGSAFRVTATLGDNRQIISMPRKQTFEEMIQAKRKQQNLLYAASHSNTTSTALSDRAARRVSAAARRRATARATASRPRPSQPVQEQVVTARSRPLGLAPSSTTRRASPPKRKSPSKSSRSSKTTSSPVKSQNNVAPSTSTGSAATSAPIATGPAVIPTIAAIVGPISSLPGNSGFQVRTTLLDDKSRIYDRVQIISSMKELSRKNPSLGSMEKKEIKRMLKSAPPGSALVLPNGTMVRKSRRGGARAGAGRKRNRPLSSGETGSPTKDSIVSQSDSSDMSFSTPNSKINQSLASSANMSMEPPATSAATSS